MTANDERALFEAPRFRSPGGGVMTERPDGGWVRWEDHVAALQAARKPASAERSDPHRELPSKDLPWTADDWSTWAYQLGLRLDRFMAAIGVDNRDRLEHAVQMLHDNAAPRAENPVLPVAHVWRATQRARGSLVLHFASEQQAIAYAGGLGLVEKVTLHDDALAALPSSPEPHYFSPMRAPTHENRN